MSHTSQRRGLAPDKPGQELIVLAMIPKEFKDKPGIGSAMSELAMKMLEHKPHFWLSKNYHNLKISKLGPASGMLGPLHKRWPESTQKLMLFAASHLSSVITAIYTDPKKVAELIEDLKGDWLQTNREKGYPISIVLSGLFGDVRECCQQTGLDEYTYLHSLGFFGKVEELPTEDELKLITMCGHGLIATNRVRDLVKKINLEMITVEAAAENISRPCICGIVNQERAQEIFLRLSQKKDG